MKTKTDVIEIRRANGEWYAVVKTRRTSDVYRAKDLMLGYAWNRFEDVQTVAISTLRGFLEMGAVI